MFFQVLNKVLAPSKRLRAENAPERHLTGMSAMVPHEFSHVHEFHATFIAYQLPSTVRLKVPVQRTFLRKGH